MCYIDGGAEGRKGRPKAEAHASPKQPTMGSSYTPRSRQDAIKQTTLEQRTTKRCTSCCTSFRPLVLMHQGSVHTPAAYSSEGTFLFLWASFYCNCYVLAIVLTGQCCGSIQVLCRSNQHTCTVRSEAVAAVNRNLVHATDQYMCHATQAHLSSDCVPIISEHNRRSAALIV